MDLKRPYSSVSELTSVSSASSVPGSAVLLPPLVTDRFLELTFRSLQLLVQFPATLFQLAPSYSQPSIHTQNHHQKPLNHKTTPAISQKKPTLKGHPKKYRRGQITVFLVYIAQSRHKPQHQNRSTRHVITVHHIYSHRCCLTSVVVVEDFLKLSQKSRAQIAEPGPNHPYDGLPRPVHGLSSSEGASWPPGFTLTAPFPHRPASCATSSTPSRYSLTCRTPTPRRGSDSPCTAERCATGCR